MQQASIQLETLACPSCMQKIENGVKALEGVDKELEGHVQLKQGQGKV